MDGLAIDVGALLLEAQQKTLTGIRRFKNIWGKESLTVRTLFSCTHIIDFYILEDI